MKTMTKYKQCYKAKKTKPKRLSKADYKKYIDYLNDNFTMCQFEGCGYPIDDWHHSKFGAYGADKDDRTLVGLCRLHHEQAHEHKEDTQEKLLPIAKSNWEGFSILNN